MKFLASKKHDSNLSRASGIAIVLLTALVLVGFFRFFLHREACPTSEVVIAANERGDKALVRSTICDGWGGSQWNSVILQFRDSGRQIVVARADDALYPRWSDDTQLIIYVANKKSVDLLEPRIEDVHTSLTTAP